MANTATKAATKAATKGDLKAPSPELIRQLQNIGDYRERKAFYEAHHELALVIDPVNFPD